MSLRDLRECVSSVGRRAWPFQRRHHLVWSALRRERAEKELPRRNAPFPATRLQHDGSAAHDESEWYFSTRIRVSDRAAECSAVARLEMPDPWQRHRKQRDLPRKDVRT
jgi:hypothetical protein